jgi:hypothetical protein
MNDADGDDYGDRSASGGVAAGTDCDDTDAEVAPGSCDPVAGTVPGVRVEFQPPGTKSN